MNPTTNIKQGSITLRFPAGETVSYEALDRAFLEEALRLAEGNAVRASRSLGISRDQFRYRVAKYGIAYKPNALGSVASG